MNDMIRSYRDEESLGNNATDIYKQVFKRFHSQADNYASVYDNENFIQDDGPESELVQNFLDQFWPNRNAKAKHRIGSFSKRKRESSVAYVRSKHHLGNNLKKIFYKKKVKKSFSPPFMVCIYFCKHLAFILNYYIFSQYFNLKVCDPVFSGNSFMFSQMIHV